MNITSLVAMATSSAAGIPAGMLSRMTNHHERKQV